MIIKPETLASFLAKSASGFFILTGPENYILHQSANLIKKFYHSQHSCEEKIIDADKSQDWGQILEASSSLSLFSDITILDLRWEKKTLDAQIKEILQQFCKNHYSHSPLIIRAPKTAHKQWEWLSPQMVTIIPCNLLNPQAMLKWIVGKLHEEKILFEPEVPELVLYLNQGNLWACAQTIEKFHLMCPQEKVTANLLKEMAHDQADFQPYELTDACLAGNLDKVIHFLQLASKNKTEPALLLWMLTQEIRLLIELHYLITNAVPSANACKQLNIWPSKQQLYQAAKHRLPLHCLYELLQQAKNIDERIKTNQLALAWLSLEKLGILFCHKA
jgi:DNA polymerase-3 subunit delta